MSDAILQHPVGGKADGVHEVLGFQEFVNLGRGEGGIATEVTPERLVAVSSDHRLQRVAPLRLDESRTLRHVLYSQNES